MTVSVMKWVVNAALGATMLLSGGHFVYYLFHWEWIRAQIAGIVLVATLVVAATRLVLARIERMQREVSRRLDALDVGGSGARRGPADRLRDGEEPDFRWLAAELSPPRRGAAVPLLLVAPVLAPLGPVGAVSQPRTAVFIPVLLGAGLAVSLVAGLVERTSAVLHGADRAGGWRLLLTATAIVAIAASTVAGIWYTAHYRPAPFGEGTTELTVQVSTQARQRPAEQTVDLMGRFCSRSAISGVTVREVRARTEDSAVLVVSPVLDAEAQRRYSGCIQDARLERHRLTVTETVLIPSKGTTP